jgi:serine phosphatase RsbU (regulator of sigma subunit)
MFSNSQLVRRWYIPSISIKPVVLSLFFFLCTINQAESQLRTQLVEDLKIYEQAVKNKEYEKSAEYAITIANHYAEIKDLTKTIDYLNQAHTYAKKLSDNFILYAVSHQLGIYNTELKKHTKALDNFQSALSVARKLDESNLIKEELINISISYGNTERYKKSIEYAEEALSLALANGDSPLQQKCYQLLAGYHDKQGNKKKATEYQAQYDLLVSAQQHEALTKQEIKQLEQHIEKEGLEKLSAQSKLSEETKKLLQSNASLKMIEHSLSATMDSLKEIEEISKNRQMEIDLLQKDKDLLQKDKELSAIKISEQEAHIQNEALVRNFILVGSLLSVALIMVLIISYLKKRRTNKKIEQQNKNIKSSINYAKRIQEAMLPKIEQYPQVFQDSFILFQPRDTVSGDFYWLSDIKRTVHHSDIAFAAVDCTGHGVPGAFMSMIGINALNGLINRGITEANIMLDSLDYEIRTALRQEISGNNDGMDVALCIYRQKEKILEFSGAKNPLVYIQDKELFQIKGDIHSIGGRKTKSHFHYRKHEIRIDKPTVIYLFSDGYKDQFGGKDNGKFLSKKLNKLLLEIHHLSMPEQMFILEATIKEWTGKRLQTDDILVIGLKLEQNA